MIFDHQHCFECQQSIFDDRCYRLILILKTALYVKVVFIPLFTNAARVVLSNENVVDFVTT